MGKRRLTETELNTIANSKPRKSTRLDAKSTARNQHRRGSGSGHDGGAGVNGVGGDGVDENEIEVPVQVQDELDAMYNVRKETKMISSISADSVGKLDGGNDGEDARARTSRHDRTNPTSKSITRLKQSGRRSSPTSASNPFEDGHVDENDTRSTSRPKPKPQNSRISHRENHVHFTKSTKLSSQTTPRLVLHERTGSLFSDPVPPPGTLLIHACNAQGFWGKGIAAEFRARYPDAYERNREYIRAGGDSNNSNNKDRQDAGKDHKVTTTALLVTPESTFSSTFPSGPSSPSSHPTIAPKNSSTTAKTKKAIRAKKQAKSTTSSSPVRTGHFIGCLYTNLTPGVRKGKASVQTILDNTAPAMRDLLRKVQAWNQDCDRERDAGVSSEAAVHEVEGTDGAKGRKERIQRIWMCRINSGLFGVPWEETKEVLQGIEVVDDVPGQVEVWVPE